MSTLSPSPSAEQTLWYYVDANNQVAGPVVFSELQRLARAGIVGTQTYVIQDGGAEWRMFANVAGLTSITSIQFKPTGLLTNGYIQFSFMGGQETKGGLFDATKDENTVMFKRSQQRAFEHIKAEIDRQLSASRSAPNRNHSHAHLDELERLADLKTKGIITAADFEAKKRQLLGL